MRTIFDIETGPLPDAQLDALTPPFSAPANYKDPEKISSWQAEAKARWKERAALSAMTGKVLAIGYQGVLNAPNVDARDESVMIRRFWDELRFAESLVGFCCRSFDIPFLVQRSFILGIPVPVTLFEGRYLSRDIIDLQEVWLCFSREREGASLDAVCRACGIGGKTGSGADFARLFATDKEAALRYLKDDIELTWKLSERLLA